MENNYTSPVLRLLDVRLSEGFAASVGGSQEDYREGGDYVW